jgi:lipopolysaccharide export system protein LptA
MIIRKSPNNKVKSKKLKAKSLIPNLNFLILTYIFAFCLLPFAFAQDESKSIIVNGDVVEYSTEKQEVTAAGNVSILYKGAKLTCEKITVNTATKVGVAEGNARLEDEKGIILGSKIVYDFQNKKGEIVDAEFRSQPFFGKARTIHKESDAEFIALNGYMSTCNLDNPHFRFKSKKIDFFPKDKAKINGASVYVAKIPLFYLPKYVHSLKDPTMHVQLVPGQRKDWGAYMLSAWHYSITENISGRIYFDYRQKFGLAQGFGTNYSSKSFGRGDFKYYYTHETPNNLPVGSPNKFQRYFVRWRHRWDIDRNTNVISEYYKIVDSKRMLLGTNYNILKDYFPREYEKDSQPLSYLSTHHSFTNSSIDLVIQKRVNRWYSQLEKLPEIKYNLPNLKIGETPFYFENATQGASYSYKYAVPSASDINMGRIDTANKISLPVRIAFMQLTPFVKNEETFYSKQISGESNRLRNIFYVGFDASTKFYRIFDVKSNFLGMDINGLRHIITPTISYSYNLQPNIQSSELGQIDAIDAITHNNSATLELSNKLQTKRNNQTVDLANFRVNTIYALDSKAGDIRDSGFSDFLFYLDLLPYSWMRVDGDATYSRTEKAFTLANIDLNFYFDEERSFGIGERYQKEGGNELTASTNWRINPKWRFYVYERFQFANVAGIKKGLREQEYGISRDLHCWEVSLNFNIKNDAANTIWLIFKMKAFPEMQFDFNQSYHAPKPGSQPNP